MISNHGWKFEYVKFAWWTPVDIRSGLALFLPQIQDCWYSSSISQLGSWAHPTKPYILLPKGCFENKFGNLLRPSSGIVFHTSAVFYFVGSELEQFLKCSGAAFSQEERSRKWHHCPTDLKDISVLTSKDNSAVSASSIFFWPLIVLSHWVQIFFLF